MAFSKTWSTYNKIVHIRLFLSGFLQSLSKWNLLHNYLEVKKPVCIFPLFQGNTVIHSHTAMQKTVLFVDRFR